VRIGQFAGVIPDVLEAQRSRLFLWLPVMLGVGVWIYFYLNEEPDRTLVGIIGAGVTSLVLLAWALPYAVSIFLRAGLVIGIGFLLATARAHLVQAPVMGWRYYGPVEGRIIALDRSASNKPRVTLDQVVLSRVGPAKTPAMVRVSLHSPGLYTDLKPGARIVLTASLAPPAPPVEPRGFDFQRMAWFRGLGAVGYSRTPVLLALPARTGSLRLWIFDVRMRASDYIRSQIPGQTGAFAAAIITGDRSAIDPAMMQALRGSNLAHLLAISGLHMGLLTGFVFALVRYGLALVPPLALRLPGKKIGAVVALFAGLGYLMISGANVATQRAFIMVSVMLVAVLLDRPAITLRAVAIAATLVLILRPESLIEAGFQMSFAATTALVGSFEYLKSAGWWQAMRQGRARQMQPVLALILSSAIAGAATAPFSAYNFNQIAQFGLLANLASVPVMGLVVMPSAVLAGLLSLVGLQALPFWVMGLGIEWILAVAEFVSSLDGAISYVPSADQPVLPLIALGALLLMLWRGRLRLLGLLLVVAGFAIWFQTQRPDLLITDNGRMIGFMRDGDRALNREKGNGFAANSWLENDGDSQSQFAAAQRYTGPVDDMEFLLSDRRVAYVWSKDIGSPGLQQRCARTDLLIAPQWPDKISGRCLTIDMKTLQAQGAIAVYLAKGGLKIESVRQTAGARLWNSKIRR
jgi:competence protein ComEC